GAGGVIFSTWTQSQGTGATESRFGRFGTFILGPTPTPTITPTGTPPTFTPTVTRTRTFTVTPTPSCGGGLSNYITSTTTSAIVPGTTYTGNHIDDGDTLITLPFT